TRQPATAGQRGATGGPIRASGAKCYKERDTSDHSDMSNISSTRQNPYRIQATIRYVVKGESAIFYPADREKSYWPPDDHEMTITDARPFRDELSVARNGFALLQHRSAVRDFFDESEIERVLVPEVTQLGKQLNGAARAIAFAPVARTDDPSLPPGQLPSLR